MSSFKRVLFVSAAVAWLGAHALPGGSGDAYSGTDACSTKAWIATQGACLYSCPAGDGSSLSFVNAVITVVVKDLSGVPIPGIPATDFWVFGCADQLVLCAGSNSINADHDTDASGMTTLSGAVATGGCDTGVKVVVFGVPVPDPQDCAQDLCLPLEVRSADIDGNCAVNVSDFGLLGLDYPSPPKVYNPCVDFNCAADLGVDVGIVDFGLYGLHHFH